MSEAMTKQEAIAALRDLIIEQINEYHYNAFHEQYDLTNLTCDEAAECFPGEPRWDLANFMLNLKDGSLSVLLSCHSAPDMKSDSAYDEELLDIPTDNRPLTAAEFRAIVLKYKLDPILGLFETEEDWRALIDDRMKAAADHARAEIQKDIEAQEIEDRLNYAIYIPDHFKKLQPQMDLLKLSLSLSGNPDRSVLLVQRDHKYYLNDRPLSPAESIWVEIEVSDANQSRIAEESDDESVPAPECPEMDAADPSDGSHRMNIVIKRMYEEPVELTDYPDSSAFSDLLDDLELLFEFGALTPSERSALEKKIRERERSRIIQDMKSVMLQAWGKLRRGGNRK